MVGETGAVNSISACPLCPNFQEYLCNIFSYLARQIQPVAIWVEDDWRLSNPDKELGWGGCFCNLHMERFAEKIGQVVTREQLVGCKNYSTVNGCVIMS